MNYFYFPVILFFSVIFCYDFDKDYQKVKRNYKCDKKSCNFDYPLITSKTIDKWPQNCPETCGILTLNQDSDVPFDKLNSSFAGITYLYGGIRIENTTLKSLPFFPDWMTGDCKIIGIIIKNNSQLEDVISIKSLMYYDGCFFEMADNKKLDASVLCAGDDWRYRTSRHVSGNKVDCGTSFIVGLKTNSVEFQAEGTTVEEAVKMCEDYEKTGFDFVELSGGTYEHFAFQHERESTKRREAFFLEFAEKIRPPFKNTVVYVTGGFRTVPAMIEAVTSGATQGIGLGRPATAEPDLPKKILDGSVSSGVYDLLDPNNFFLTLLASYAQMEQMGRQSGGVASAISDFSDKETVDKLNEKIGEYVKAIQRRAEEGIVKPAILYFD